MIQSPEATRRALEVTAQAKRSNREPAEIIAEQEIALRVVRRMVARYQADHFRGRADQWATLARLLRL